MIEFSALDMLDHFLFVKVYKRSYLDKKGIWRDIFHVCFDKSDRVGGVKILRSSFLSSCVWFFSISYAFTAMLDESKVIT